MHFEFQWEVVPGVGVEVAKTGSQTFILMGKKLDPNGSKDTQGRATSATHTGGGHRHSMTSAITGKDS